MAASFRSFLRLTLLVVLVIPAPAVAQDRATPDTAVAPPDTLRPVGLARADTVLALPPVTVRARRPRTQPLAAPRRVTTLSAREIAATGAQNAADLLAARTGLFVKRYGSGGLATLSLRGTSSGQTLLLVDGQRVADPQTGQVDLSLLPTVLLRSVEVMHGAASARYGSGSFGGVVRLRTLQPTDEVRARASGTVGAYGQRTAGLVARGGRGALSALVAMETSRAEGDFPYVNEALLAEPTVRRQGADRSLTTTFGKLRYDGERQDLTLTAWLTGADRGLPGTASTRERPGTRQQDEHRRFLLRSTTHLGWGTLHASGRVQQTRLRYTAPAPGAGDTSRTESYALDVRGEGRAGAHWHLEGGSEAAYEGANLRGGVGRMRTAAFTGATGKYGRFTFRPSLRLDTYFSEEERARTVAALSPSLGLNLQPFPWEGVRVKGHVGRAFRAPTLNERFYLPGGNPDLRAEDGWSGEVGLAARFDRRRGALKAEATAFAARIRDQIVWTPSFIAPGVQGWRPRNVARVLTRGVEVSTEGRFRVTGGWQIDGHLLFTHTNAENRSRPAARAYGRQLPYVPKEQLKMHLGTAFSLPGRGRLRLGVSGRLVSERFFTADETQSVPAYQVFDAQLRFEQPLGPVRATLGLAVENLTNEDYQVIRLYPMPPRHARLRLTLEAIP